MGVRTIQVAAIACITAAATATSAPIIDLSVTPGTGSAAIVLAVSNDAGERPDVLGFDVIREEFKGSSPYGQCFEWVDVTDDFLPRPNGISSYVFQVEDDTFVEGRAYRYYVEGYPRVQSGMHWSVGFNHDRSWTIVTAGSALIADGVKVYNFGGQLSLQPCVGCASVLELVASAPSEVLDPLYRGAWRLFGTVRPRADYHRYEWVVESVEPTDCIDFAVVPSAWGMVKTLYR